MADPMEQIVEERNALRLRVAELEAKNTALRTAGIDGTAAGYQAAREVLDEWAKKTEEMKAIADKAFTLAAQAVEQRDIARANWQGADGRADAMERERDAYIAMLRDVLASAHPNERDHPAMSKVWKRAEKLLENGVPVGAAQDRINQLERDLAATNEILDCYKRTVAEGGPVSTNLAEQVAGLKRGLTRLMPLRSLVGDYAWSELDRHDLASDEHLAEKVIAAFQHVERDEKAYREEQAAKEQAGG